jgi:uracil-DNA glycosylase family 4
MTGLAMEERQRTLDALQAEMRVCRRCVDAGFAVEGPAVFSGPATAHVMIIGQAPAQIDLRNGSRPWSGTGGRRLIAWLAQAGFEEATLRANHYLAALTRCFPGKLANGRGDRAPSKTELQLCAPFLRSELEIIGPQLIVAVGKMAIERFLGPSTLSERIGRDYPPDAGAPAYMGVAMPPETRILPLPHPSGASLWLNQPENLALVEGALRRLAQLKTELCL